MLVEGQCAVLEEGLERKRLSQGKRGGSDVGDAWTGRL